ncbi:MAG TPA: sensor histidine kinase, partial [Trebonia sp.]|nr:sensor histidine kinase [Trebonia sp.]
MTDESIDPGTQRRLDAWEGREYRTFMAVPYVMLGFCALLTLLIRSSLGGRWGLDLGLIAGAAAWLALWDLAVPSWREHPRRSPLAQAVFFIVLIGFMLTMILADPWFGFFTFTGYFYAGRLPYAAWRIAGIAAVAVLTGTSQAGGFSTLTSGGAGAAVWTGVVAVNLAVAGGFSWFAWVGDVQRKRRSRLVEELSEANRRLEATLAENAGLHEQLVVQAHEAGTRDERQRMAREIHDTLAQGLTGIITQLQAAEQAAEDPVERRRHFDAATRLARDSLSEARRSVGALRPEPLVDARLADALASVAERWTGLQGVPVEVTTTGTARPLPPEAEVVLLRVAQEALANVAKHAAATRVWLTLSYMDCEVALDIRDDGRGFGAAVAPAVSAGLPVVTGRGPDGPAVNGVAARGMAAGAGAYGAAAVSSGREGGFGLMAMRQRVEGLAGTLQVESEPGNGTVISACVPARLAARPAPATTAPATTALVGTVPAGTVPAGTVPAGTVPAGTVPAGTVPAGTVPAGTVPAGT